MKSVITTKSKLRRRMILSFAFALLLAAFVVGGFQFVEQQDSVDEAPALLRGFFDWNAKIWRHLQSSTRLSVEKSPPPRGQAPRVNGDVGLDTQIDLSTYAIEVINGNERLQLSLKDLQSLPRASVSSDFKCIEGWSEVFQYAGARFSEVMDKFKIGKKNDGTYYEYVGLETPDGEYYVSIDMKSMLHPQTLLAFEMNGMPLAMKNGAPLRLIIPIKYGVKSLKRIAKIVFSDERPPDYWAERGYDWYSGL